MEQGGGWQYSETRAKELEDFAQREGRQLTNELCQILVSIAKTGLTCYAWEHLRVLLRFVIEKNMVASNEQVADCGAERGSTFEERKIQILGSLDSFVGPPFTLQRLCELLVEPQQYTSTKKYLNALEKMFAVSQTIATLTPAEYDKEAAKQTTSFLAVTNSVDAANNTTGEEKEGDNSTPKVVGTGPVDMEL